jgi:hypothetical protein
VARVESDIILYIDVRVVLRDFGSLDYYFEIKRSAD